VRAVIYARVSTDKQTHDSQLQEVRGYCQRRGWRDCREIIATASGAKTRRTGRDDLMASVRRGKVETVVCEVIRDRVSAGLAAARQRGVRLGRPNTLNKHAGAVAALVAQGIGVCEISRRLALPLSSTHKLVKALLPTWFG
jgi:DNA invertase Pin-like site-specific DNA recombinase